METKNDGVAVIRFSRGIFEEKMRPNLIFNKVEEVCRVSKDQAVKGLSQSREGKELKRTLNMKNINNLDIENHKDFPNANRILTAVRTEQGSENIWVMLQEANSSSDFYPPFFL